MRDWSTAEGVPKKWSDSGFRDEHEGAKFQASAQSPTRRGTPQRRFNMENLTIKVYGSGCKGCQTLHQNVIDALAEMNIAADVQYITDMKKIMESGVMGLPALAVNDKIVSAGKVLNVAEVKNIWLKMVAHKKAVN